MESAAASLDSTQLEVFAVNVPGTKSMIKVSESAESPVTQDVYSTSANNLVCACLNTSKCLMEPAVPAQSTPPTVKSPKNVSATVDTLKTLASAHQLAMPMKNGSMELVNVKKDTT